MTTEDVQQILAGNTYDKWMDYKVQRIENGKATLLFTGKPECHGNRRGQVHGGAIIGITDTVMGMACFSLGKSVTTLDLSGNYVKPIILGETVRYEAEVVHNGRTTMVTEVKVYGDSDNSLRYVGRGTFFVLGAFTEEDAKKLAAK